MSEQVNYEELLPRQPSEGALEWCIRTKFSKEYAIYRSACYQDPLTGENRNGVRVTCTACGASWIAEKARGAQCQGGYAPFGFVEGIVEIGGGKQFRCPECGRNVTAVHVGMISKAGIDDNEFFLEPWRMGDKFVLLGWRAERNIGKDAVKTYRMWPYEAYVFEARKCVRLTGYQKCMTRLSFFDRWRQLKKCEDKWERTGTGNWFGGWPETDGTTAENSALRQYLTAAGEDAFPVTYLRLWQKHRNIENLIVQGCAEMVADSIERNAAGYGTGGALPTLDWIDWKQKRPSAMLGLNKDEFRFCVKEHWGEEQLDKYKIVRAREPVRLPEDWQYIERESAYALNKLSEEKGLLPSAVGGHCMTLWRGKLSMLRCLRYLYRQGQSIVTLMDYWSVAARARIDLTDEHNQLPKDLTREHDRLAKLERIAANEAEKKRRAQEIEERRTAFEKTVAPLEAWSWADGGTCIRPVHTEQELIDEGAALHHCVGTYGAAVARGESCIFFIRHEDRPDESWFTLQVELKTLREIQNHGLRNRPPTKEVQEFVNRWLDHVRQLTEAGKKRGKKEEAA